MKTVYLNEPGVSPWESPHALNDTRFTTTTLIDHDFHCVWEAWCSVMEQLLVCWPYKREWRSALTAHFNSRAEEYLFKKNIAKTLKPHDICKKSEKTHIYSTIKILPNNPREIEHLALEGSHDVLLIVQKKESRIDDLWSKMTIFENHISPENIGVFLESQPDTLICRFYDAETHAAAQLIYQTAPNNDDIKKKLKSSFKNIKTEDVHHYINNTKRL